MQNLITILISSTVISAIITAVFNYFSKRRDNYLKYFIAAQTNWRNSISKIAKELPNARGKKLEQLLIQIETLINAYGQNGNATIKLINHTFSYHQQNYKDF